MNLENLGVLEMNAIEAKLVDGGNLPMASYMAQDQVSSLGSMVGLL